mmetsp:Transcript_46742/g.141633  ORF Transcript_46742/g.141633 Transcript_46742/m.141633 type:complete len:207 (+) Transcript_46742:560-1180(+)
MVSNDADDIREMGLISVQLVSSVSPLWLQLVETELSESYVTSRSSGTSFSTIVIATSALKDLGVIGFCSEGTFAELCETSVQAGATSLLVSISAFISLTDADGLESFFQLWNTFLLEPPIWKVFLELPNDVFLEGSLLFELAWSNRPSLFLNQTLPATISFELSDNVVSEGSLLFSLARSNQSNILNLRWWSRLTHPRLSTGTEFS